MDDKDIYTEANKREKVRTIMSPSGRFRLEVAGYSTKHGCWDHTRGIVYRVGDGAEVCDIKRNYSTFHHSFVTKNGQEWLITGRSYMGQTIVNLDTGVEYNDSKYPDKYEGWGFCWADAQLSEDGNTLTVEGCHWACPYEFVTFDFTDPSKGWPELERLDDGEDS